MNMWLLIYAEIKVSKQAIGLIHALYKWRSVQSTGACYPDQGWFGKNLGCGWYIFLFFFIPLRVWLRTVHDCHHAQCPLPLSIVIRMGVIRQSNLPACLAGVQLYENTLRHLYHKADETDRQNGWHLYQCEVFSTRAKWKECLLHTCV